MVTLKPQLISGTLKGRFYGPRSPEVRSFTNNPNNYRLEPTSFKEVLAPLWVKPIYPSHPSRENHNFGISDIGLKLKIMAQLFELHSQIISLTKE